MIAKEIKTSISTVRIHDELCRPVSETHLAAISRIVSNSYKQRKLPPAQTANRTTSAPQ